MAMRAFHINKDGVKTEVTGVITELTISGEYRKMCIRDSHADGLCRHVR